MLEVPAVPASGINLCELFRKYVDNVESSISSNVKYFYNFVKRLRESTAINHLWCIFPQDHCITFHPTLSNILPFQANYFQQFTIEVIFYLQTLFVFQFTKKNLRKKVVPIEDRTRVPRVRTFILTHCSNIVFEVQNFFS